MLRTIDGHALDHRPGFTQYELCERHGNLSKCWLAECHGLLEASQRRQLEEQLGIAKPNY